MRGDRLCHVIRDPVQQQLRRARGLSLAADDRPRLRPDARVVALDQGLRLQVLAQTRVARRQRIPGRELPSRFPAHHQRVSRETLATRPQLEAPHVAPAQPHAQLGRGRGKQPSARGDSGGGDHVSHPRRRAGPSDARRVPATEVLVRDLKRRALHREGHRAGGAHDVTRRVDPRTAADAVPQLLDPERTHRVEVDGHPRHRRRVVVRAVRHYERRFGGDGHAHIAHREQQGIKHPDRVGLAGLQFAAEG